MLICGLVENKLTINYNRYKFIDLPKYCVLYPLMQLLSK